MDYRIETKLSVKELCLLPLFTPYSIRHLKKSGWGNKFIGAIELFPVISLIATVVERCVQACFKKPPVNTTPQKTHQRYKAPAHFDATERVAVVANKKIFMKHLTGDGHPEAPARVEAIENALTLAGLMKSTNTLEPRPATSEEIALCHRSFYREEVQTQVNALKKGDEKRSVPFKKTEQCQTPYVGSDFNISSETLNTSLYAAGAPLTAIEHILDESNSTTRAFCIVRPPGHHAHQNTGSGFCVFNNVAIAAKFLTRQLKFERVLIVDWDAHHGEGTQEMTETDDKIYYFSTHRDTAEGFYPGSHWGKADETGKCRQRNVMNCPVSGSKEKCRRQILEAFRQKLVPAMEQYKPDFVLISCGFDAHENDSLVGLGLKDEDYREMTKICVQIAEKHAKGRVVSVLEGGYNLDAISGAAKVHVEELGKIYTR